MEYPPVALTDAMADSIVDDMAQQFAHDDRYPIGQLRDAIREALYLPPHLPPVTALVTGRDGTIWLRREEVSDSVDWDVLDASAEPVATLRTPRGLTIHSAERGSVWGVETDELDVNYVVRYRVVESAGN